MNVKASTGNLGGPEGAGPVDLGQRDRLAGPGRRSRGAGRPDAVSEPEAEA